MNTSPACRWLLPALAVLGLASCSDRLPIRPQIEPPGPEPIVAPVSDSTLAANRARWSDLQIDEYWYRFRWHCFCASEDVRVVDILVARGAVVSVVDAETGKPLSAQDAARYRTVDGLFDFLRGAVDYPAFLVQAAFDSRLGYPAAAWVDYAANIADEEMGFRVYSLQPIRRL